MPRVSVIIPAHNAAPFIEQTLASVREQTYQDWEVVVADDGSSDRTWELLQDAGAGVRSFHRDEAGGPAVARNLALSNATGEFVMFLDADDLLLPRYLESQLACYQAASRSAGPEVGLVACDARILIGEDYAPYTHLERVPDRHEPITLERVLRRNPIYGACLVPTPVGEAVGWFDPELFGTEDFGLWIKILEADYRAVLNEEVLAVYRRTPGTVSSNIASQAVNNRCAYELALGRGRLNTRERRIARRAIRYNHAMEQVALLRFSQDGARASALHALRSLPLLASGGAQQPADVAGVAGAASHRARQRRGRAARPFMNDDITVVITCFNYGEFLAESVASALEQEGGEPRVIVVDDGSTDAHTLAELDRLPPQVEVVHQANGGLSDARNTGLRRAQTPYALALDADDKLARRRPHAAARATRGRRRARLQLWAMRFFGEWEGVVSCRHTILTGCSSATTSAIWR